MAIGPNKNNNNSENNENSPLSPGDIRRAVHISPPLPGRQSFLLDPTSRRAREDMMRRIVSEEIQVREELGEMSHHNLHPPSLLLPDQNIQAPYQLQFFNKVQDPTFTSDLVRDEIGVPIKVAIFDTSTESIIPPNSILSSSKVRIMVVDAEYWKNRVNWSISEFIENVLSEREGKRLILTGHSLIIQLKNGVGTFENIVFNDNSSWTKNGFRLAVMVKGEREEGYFNGERVQEGVSERFRVKDRRGKETKKPDRLELTHSVRLINKIGKDRASCLENKNINTVEDFLKLYYNDESALRKILGIKSQSGKAWESMVKHVMQCDGEYQNKCIASNTSSQPQQDCVIVPSDENLFLSTNGLGSSKPNPSDSYIIEGDVSAINRQHVPISNFSLMNLPNQPISAGRMVQYTGERHNAGGDGGNYNGIDGGTYGDGGNYGGGGIDGGTYGGGGGIGIGNYGGGGGIGIGIGNYGGGGGIGNYGGGIGIGNYGGGGGIGIGNYGGSGGGIGIGNYGGGGGIGIGNYGGGGGIGIGNYGGGRGIDIGNYGGGGIGIGNYGGGIGIGIGNYGGDIGIGNYGGGGIGIGNYGGSGGIGNYGGGGIGIVNYGAGGSIGNYGSGGGGIGIGNYSGGGICNYGGSGEIGIDNYGGGGIGNYGSGGGGIGIGNYSGGGIGNYGGSGEIGIDNYGGGGIGNYGGGGGNGGIGIGNYGGGGIGIGNCGSGGGIGIGIGNYSGGGGIGNDGGTGGGYYSGNYCGGGSGTYGRDGGGIDSDTYGSCGGGIDNYGDGGNGGGSVNYCGGGGGRDWFGSSFTGRERSMAVFGLEGLSLEGSQT